LTWEPGGQQIDRGKRIEGGEVPEVGYVGHVRFEPCVRSFVNVRDEHRLDVHARKFQTVFESGDASAKTADSHDPAQQCLDAFQGDQPDRCQMA
tara:strand:- start:33 stop:314 length:282 start_codon:yes stop_codon:yes gene_type:complete